MNSSASARAVINIVSTEPQKNNSPGPPSCGRNGDGRDLMCGHYGLVNIWLVG